jgi:flagellar biosynthesis protein FliR
MFDLSQIATGLATVGMRISGLLLFAPFPGGSGVPVRIKSGLAMVLTFCLFPTYGLGMPEVGVASLVPVALSEMAIGALLGLSLSFVFDAAQMAGQSMGLQVGFSLVNVIDPQSQVETPVLATLHQLIVLLIFLQFDVHHWLLRGLANSFEYLPISSFHLTGAVVERLLHAAGGILLAGVQIAAPMLLATMAADITLGFIAKASQQLQVLFVGMSVKTLLALAVWMAALRFWPAMFERYFARGVALGEQLLQLSR